MTDYLPMPLSQRLRTLGLPLADEAAERIEELVKADELSDQIIAGLDRVLDACPCPVHGPCVPYVLEKLDAAEGLMAACQRVWHMTPFASPERETIVAAMAKWQKPGKDGAA